MKSEVEALVLKARESLQAAALLRSEGYQDFAVSRLYYAMFYATEALLLDRGLSFSSHSAVIAAFGREFAKAGILDPRFHRYLIDAQDLRNLADYGIGVSVSEAESKELLSWAQEFVETVEATLASRGRQSSKS